MRGFRALGSALLVIVLAAVLANLGVIPTYRAGDVLYDGIFGVVAPLGVFWLLLGVRLGDLRRAGKTMIGLFLVGAAGTTVGVIGAYAAVDGGAAFGDRAPALAGMFVGTYIGGSVNFNAIALAHGVQNEGVLYAGANAVDALMTTVLMVATLLLPPLLRRGADGAPTRDAAAAPVDAVAAEPDADGLDVEAVSPRSAMLLLAIGAAVLAVCKSLPAPLDRAWMLVLTTVALVLAQLPAVARISGARVLGMTAVLLFLAVIGALCDVEALASLGRLGGTLFAFVGLTLLVHGLAVFGVARALRLDPDQAAVASQANIGGGTSALALARGLGRGDLVLPAILIGSLGNALGTYLGDATVRILAAAS